MSPTPAISSFPRCFVSKCPHSPGLSPSLPTTKPLSASCFQAALACLPVGAGADWRCIFPPSAPRRSGTEPSSQPREVKPAWLASTQLAQWQAAACLGQAPTSKPTNSSQILLSLRELFSQSLTGWPNLGLLFFCYLRQQNTQAWEKGKLSLIKCQASSLKHGHSRILTQTARTTHMWGKLDFSPLILLLEIVQRFFLK